MRLIFILLISCIINSYANNRPNVLLISIDDLNDWVGYLEGHPQVQTPNIDRLAKMGTAFTDAHCSSPLCNPSRTSLLTGLHSPNTGVFNNKGSFKYKNFELMPQYFAKHGYQTYGVGKIHHKKINQTIFQDGLDLPQRWSPFQEKDQELYTAEELPSKGTTNPKHFIKNGPGGKNYTMPFNRLPSDRAATKKSGESHDWQSFDLPDNAFGDGMATEWAINKLKAHNTEKPFFMGLGFYRPHIPLYAPKKYFDLYPLESLKLPPHQANDLDDLSSVGKKWAQGAITAGSHATTKPQWKQAVQAYLACVSFVDAQVGKVLDYIEQSAYSENTIIVLFSDHGWHLGEKEHWGKWTGWNRSTRIPFIIVNPGQKQGSQSHQLVNLIDLYPTLIDMAGLPPKQMDAKSIKHIVNEPKVERSRTVYSYFDHGNFAVINKKWRLIRYKSGEKELYNRINDPHEYNNLSSKSEYKGLIEKLEKHMPDWK
ncbi:MAG: sulfatase [Lentisphaeraceae bacterium]|nr:sulfatase [Lentisphaeraceae bacterium]